MQKIKAIFRLGLAHIFGAYSINKIISFLTNTVIVHFLSKAEYGYFGSAYNVYSIFIIFTGLGMTSAELLFCSEERPAREKRAIYKYTFLCGFVVDIVLSACMLAYGLLGQVGMPECRPYIVLLSGLPLADYVMQYLLVFLRTRRENKKFAYLSTVNSVALLLFTVVGACFGGVGGTIGGRYFAYIITIVAGIFLSRSSMPDIINKEQIDRRLKKDIWAYAVKNGACSALNTIIYLLDVAVISYVIADPEIVASYKLATIIPENLNFIPQVVIITLIPYYAKNQSNRAWLRKTTKTLFLGMAAVNLLITLFLLVSAPFVIKLLWGAQYMDSVHYYRVLSLSYFFLATFRLFSTNILAVLRKTTFNLIVAILTGVANIVLDYILITHYAAAGAAWATVMVIVIASVASFPYLVKVIFAKE